MNDEITHRGYEYRVRGGEVHSRPTVREEQSPKKVPWLVLNHGEPVPQVVRDQLTQPRGELRFD